MTSKKSFIILTQGRLKLLKSVALSRLNFFKHNCVKYYKTFRQRNWWYSAV